MAIPDFNEAELKLAQQTLRERYGREIPTETAEAEIGVGEGGDLDTCPVLYWEERGAHFVVFKVGESRFRAQFFYSEAAQYGTGKNEFNNLGDCLVTLLQVQSDHERQMAGVRSGATAKDFDDYDGPLVV
ncbi:MAG: hypothetical protein ACM3Y9_08830 [Ignavibacteria bacterium]